MGTGFSVLRGKFLKEPKRSKTMHADNRGESLTLYLDDDGNVVSQGTHNNIQKYNRLKNSLESAYNKNDYNAQYEIVEKLNGLAHKIAKKTGNKSIEKEAYGMKDDFAKKEIDRRGSGIIKWDGDKKMHYLEKPDGSPSIHVSNKVYKYQKRFNK